MLTITVICYLLVRGIVENANLYLTVRNAGTFIVFLTLPSVAIHRNNWPWLWLTFIAHGIIGLPIFYYVVATEGMTSRATFIGSAMGKFADSGLYVCAFLIFMLPIMRNRELRLLAILLFVTNLVSALLGGKRGPIFHSAVMMSLLLFIMLRTHGFHRYLTRILPSATVIYGVLAVIGIMGVSTVVNPHTIGTVREVITSAYHNLEVRMTQFGSTNEMIMQNERWTEIECVVACMSPIDWIFGKGFAGIWSSSDFAKGEERNMVHNTWLLCFFWGGVGLFVVVAWPLLWALRVILFSKSNAAMGCAAYVLLTYWKFPFFDISQITLSWILFSVAIGVCRWEVVAMRNRAKNRTAPIALRSGG
jgi:hypothetical protein